MTAAAASAQARATLGKIDEVLDLSRNKLSQVPEKKRTASERWMQYLGFPVGVLVFLSLYYMPTPEGLTRFRVLGITPGW